MCSLFTHGVENCGRNGWWPLQILYPCSGCPVFFCILGTLGLIHFAICFEMPYLEDSHVTMIPWGLKVAWRFECEAWSKLVWFCRASIGGGWVHFVTCIILRGNILGNMHANNAHICIYAYSCVCLNKNGFHGLICLNTWSPTKWTA